MTRLNLGLEIRDFDLTRMGFAFSVLDEANERASSEAYLQMTLLELDAFLKALKGSDDIQVSTVQSSAAGEPQRHTPKASIHKPEHEADDDEPGSPGDHDEPAIPAALTRAGRFQRRP